MLAGVCPDSDGRTPAGLQHPFCLNGAGPPGSEKSWNPCWLTARSNDASGNRIAAASDSTHSIGAPDICFQRATSSIGGLKSRPTTLPPRSTASAIISVMTPDLQARSMARRPAVRELSWHPPGEGTRCGPPHAPDRRFQHRRPQRQASRRSSGRCLCRCQSPVPSSLQAAYFALSFPGLSAFTRSKIAPIRPSGAGTAETAHPPHVRPSQPAESDPRVSGRTPEDSPTTVPY